MDGLVAGWGFESGRRPGQGVWRDGRRARRGLVAGRTPGQGVVADGRREIGRAHV